MIKGCVPLIKKTLVWHHRSRGDAAISFGCDQTNLRKLRILGSTEIDEDGNMISFPGAPDGSGKYGIDMHVHGKSYVDGTSFIERFASLTGGSYEESEGRYKLTIKSEHTGIVIYDERDVRFKPQTPYTIVAMGTIARGTAKQGKPNIAIRYDDGTLTPVIIVNDTSTNRFDGCFTTDKTKTIKQIEIYQQTSMTTRLYPLQFGIFEGEYATRSECFELYDGARVRISLDQPLRCIDSAKDELDLISGTLKRRICYLGSIGSATVNEGGACVIKLAEPIDTRHRILSPDIPFLEFEEWLECESGLCSGERADELYIKVNGTPADAESINAYLSDNAVRLAYVKLFPTDEQISINIPYKEGYTAIELHTELAPKLFYAEF